MDSVKNSIFQDFFLWVDTTECAALHSGLSTESSQLKFPQKILWLLSYIPLDQLCCSYRALDGVMSLIFMVADH